MVGHVSIKERQSPSPGHYQESYIKYLRKNMEILVAMIKLIVTAIHCHNGTYLFNDKVKKK